MDYIKTLRQQIGHQPLILPGAVVVIENARGEILLQHRRDGNWGLPGGLMDPGESYEETAMREVKEETGLDLQELTFIDVFSGRDYFIKIANGDELYSVTAVFSATYIGGTIQADPEETLDLKFFNLNDFPSGLTPEYKKYIEAYERMLPKTSGRAKQMDAF